MAVVQISEFFDVVIVTPDEVVFEGRAKKIMAPGTMQEIAILPDHTPLYAELIKGDVTVTAEDGQIKTVPIEGGVIRVKGNRASIVTNY